MTKRLRADQVKVKAERDGAQQTLGIVSCSSPGPLLSIRSPSTPRSALAPLAASRSLDLRSSRTSAFPPTTDLATHLMHIDAYTLLAWAPSPCGFTVVSVRDVDMLRRADGGDLGRL